LRISGLKYCKELKKNQVLNYCKSERTYASVAPSKRKKNWKRRCQRMEWIKLSSKCHCYMLHL